MDLDELMRKTTLDTLTSQHEAAVVNGDVAGAKAAADKLAEFKLATAPKPAVQTGFGDTEVKAELNKLPWFGADPKKSAKAMDAARNMSTAKFATPQAFVEAVVKAVEDDAAATTTATEEPGDDDDDAGKAATKPATRRTDGPRDDDTGARGRGAGGGAWSKLSEAPKDVQARIKASAQKFLPAAATEEQRKNFHKRALDAAYAEHQRKAK